LSRYLCARKKPAFDAVRQHAPGANAAECCNRESSELEQAVEACPFNPSINSRFAKRHSSTDTKIPGAPAKRASPRQRPARQSPLAVQVARGVKFHFQHCADVLRPTKQRQWQPILVIKIPSDFKTRSFVPNSAARISFVVVLPTRTRDGRQISRPRIRAPRAQAV